MRERLIELLENVQFKPFDQMNIENNLNIIIDVLLQNGVVVPPCKVGDVIYDIRNGKVFGGKIIMISYFGDSFTFVATGGRYYTITDIGKTVFLTREEAEQALKGGAE